MVVVSCLLGPTFIRSATTASNRPDHRSLGAVDTCNSMSHFGSVATIDYSAPSLKRLLKTILVYGNIINRSAAQGVLLLPFLLLLMLLLFKHR